VAKGSFLIANLAAGLTAAAGSSSTIAGLGWDRLNDPQPRHRARVNATSAILIWDLGSAKAVDCAALISNSLTSAATARLRASTADSTVVTSLLHDSGVQSNVTDAAWNGNVVQAISASVTARYWRWDVTDAGAPIDIGLAPLGLLFRPARNFAYGAQEGRLDLGLRDTNQDTGAQFGVSGPKPRVKIFTMPAMTKTEARDIAVSADAMDRLVGVSGDVLFVPDADDTWINRARDAIWGGFRQPSTEIYGERKTVNAWSRAFRMTERL
jgi:hypothetical protein